MQSSQLIHSLNSRRTLLSRREPDSLKRELQVSERQRIAEFPSLTSSDLQWSDSPWPCGTGELFKGLAIDARRNLGFLATYVQCYSAQVLIDEEQKPVSILFLLEGEVNISMNSRGGRQFLLRVARAGDILGLASAISGAPSEVRAVARHPCKVFSVSRQDFLDFLTRYPSASQYMTLELIRSCRRISERLRIFGLTTSVRAELASLLLDWCRDGRQTESGIQIPFALTRKEIGDCIGASRETVTRALIDFGNQKLVIVRGSILIVPSRPALAIYAGIDSIPERHESEPGPRRLSLTRG